MDATEIDRAAKLHQEAIVIDTLGSEPAAWSNQSIERLEEMIKAEMPTWQIGKRFGEMVVRDLISNEAVRAEYARMVNFFIKNLERLALQDIWEKQWYSVVRALISC